MQRPFDQVVVGRAAISARRALCRYGHRAPAENRRVGEIRERLFAGRDVAYLEAAILQSKLEGHADELLVFGEENDK